MVNQNFFFSIKEHEILPFVADINEWIEKQLPLGRPYEVFFFKSKLIITELITNAIKHANTNEFTLNIEIGNQTVKVTRIDKGKPFNLFSKGEALEWPLADHFFGKPIMILEDKLSNMSAIIKSQYCIEFKLEEFVKQNDDVINTLIEHFGLIIITKLSDQFVYSYDPGFHLNTFEATIKV